MKKIKMSQIWNGFGKAAKVVLKTGKTVAGNASQLINVADIAAIISAPEIAVPMLANSAIQKIKRRNPAATGAHAVGERGGFSLVKPEKREDVFGLLAWGPSGTLEDAEGRLYPFRWALVPLSALVVSNNPKTWAKNPQYPQELQGRNREGIASRAQVRALAAKLDAKRILLSSSTPADSAPVVWYSPEIGYCVASGNGRAMAAMIAFSDDSEAWEQYFSAVASRWNIASKMDELDRDDRFLAVRVLGGKEGASFDDARALAGASQSTASGQLTELEKSVHVGRSLGIETPISLGGIDWVGTITPKNVGEFVAKNPKFWDALTRKLDDSKKAMIKASPEAAAGLVTAALLQGIPGDVVERAYDPEGSADLVPALAGLLPTLWTLETEYHAKRTRPGWRILPVLSNAFDWYRRLGKKGVSEIRAALKDEQNQIGIDLGGDLPEMSNTVSHALGVAFAKATERASPADAMAEYLGKYAAAAAADDPSAVSMFSGDDLPEIDPGSTLLGIIDKRLLTGEKRQRKPKTNPPRGKVRHARGGGTEVLYPGGVRVQFPRRLEDAAALQMADAHYLEAIEGQGSIFPGMGRESVLRRNPWPYSGQLEKILKGKKKKSKTTLHKKR